MQFRIRSPLLLALALPLLLAILPTPAFAGLVETPYPDLTIEFPPNARAAADLAAELYPRLKERIATLFDRPYEIRTRLVLAADRAEFAAPFGDRAPPPWALAAAEPGTGSIAIRLSGLDRYQNTLSSTLLHEMVHVALGQFESEAGRALPRWFHEGVAEWASASLHLGAGDEIEFAAATDRLHALGEIDADFPADTEEARLAYQESHAFVTYLVNRHSWDRVAGLLRRFAQGADFGDAFAHQIGRSPGQEHEAWLESVTPRSPAVWLLLRTLSLWSVLAIGVFLAWLYRRRRARRILHAWESEESLDGRP